MDVMIRIQVDDSWFLSRSMHAVLRAGIASQSDFELLRSMICRTRTSSIGDRAR